MDWLCPSRTEQCNLLSAGDLARTNQSSLTPKQKDGDSQMLSVVSKLTRTSEVTMVPKEKFCIQNMDTAASPWSKWILVQFSARIPKVLLIPYLILKSLNKIQYAQRRVELRKNLYISYRENWWAQQYFKSLKTVWNIKSDFWKEETKNLCSSRDRHGNYVQAETSGSQRQ